MVSQVYWECLTHKGAIDNPRKYIAHEKLKASNIDIESIPIVEDYSDQIKCAVIGCVEIGGEYHHFAPKHLFSDEADNWPTAYLCLKHHRQWHDLVTPKMCERLK
jgi:hypothetical protein